MGLLDLAIPHDTFAQAARTQALKDHGKGQVPCRFVHRVYGSEMVGPMRTSLSNRQPYSA
jgi:hypothetical protein